MVLSRDVTLWIHFLLDDCVPSAIRDSRWFMWLPFKLLFKDKADIFFSFKERAPFLSEAEFRDIYRLTAPVHLDRETDLNQACINAIEIHTVGKTVLDVACGRGFLAKRLAQHYQVTGADIVIADSLRQACPDITWQTCNLEKLPFADGQFDTVICPHTLEHVQHPAQALIELRRVCAKRLIVVLPRQRHYRYTFDLHLHFFPYRHTVFNLLGQQAEQQCELLGGDWFYWESRS